MSRISLKQYSSKISNHRQLIVWILVIFFFLIQVIKALFPPTFFHPDEIYQSFEIGHYYYYDYGIRAWEWLSPEQSNWPEPFIGPARSLITPLIFYTLFGLGELLGFNYWLQILPMIRIFLGINTTVGLIGLSLLLKEIFPKFKENLLIIFWLIIMLYPDTILYSTTGLTNIIAISPLFWGLYLYLKSINEKNLNGLRVKSYLAGFLLGISIWIRPDFAILILIFVIIFNPFLHYFKYFKLLITKKIFYNSNLHEKYNFKDDNKNKIQIKRSAIIRDKGLNITISLLAGGLVSFTINGLLDLIMWGEFSVSILRFIDFNGNPENQSIFGTEPAGWYFENIIISRDAMNWLFTIVIFMIIISSFVLFLHFIPLIIKKLNKFKQIDTIKTEFSIDSFNLLRISIVLFLVFDWWENQPHKEFRFLLAWEFLFFCLSSISILLLFTIVNNIFRYLLTILGEKFSILTTKKINYIKTVSSIIILILILLPYFVGLNSQAKDVAWNNFDDILGAQVYVGQQKDLNGLIIIGGFWYDGGYTYLHRNVSVNHIDDPGVNSSFNSAFINDNEYNYAIAPHYKYYQYPFLKSNLVGNNWTLNALILGRTDVWTR
ncbi:MAG: hypothetical protein HeimC3_26880 [Candidatus Heimdallarchaeota archaeon LC_3]|nr:MAG: hypothetical protein HeimC3_26880 [Candidatus Heimdallarchaeota archaeon LC_3]